MTFDSGTPFRDKPFSAPRTGEGRHPLRDARVALLLPFTVLFLAVILLSAARGQEDRKTQQQIDTRETRARDRQSSMIPGVVELPVSDSTYVVGPGDILTVAIFSTRYEVYDLQVSGDGKILIPLLGEIRVKDRTLAEARRLVQGLVDQNFRSAQVTVNLTRARMIKVNVVGAVPAPGTVVLSATSRVSEAIELAGGFIKDTSSYRNIRLMRAGRPDQVVDILAYQRIGDIAQNPFVSGGDIVYVPPRDELVGIFGSVKHEGRVDFVPGERLFDLIRVAQGFRAEAFLDSVQIVRFQPDEITTRSMFLNLRSYPADTAADIPLEPSDLVLVRGMPDYHYQRIVNIIGKVKYPGSYPIERDKTRLTEIIRRAGGFAPEASLEEAIVIRKQGEKEKDREFERLSKMQPAEMREDEYEYFKARSRERVGQMTVNFKKLFLDGDLSQDITLREEDVIEVPAFKNYVRIIGRVNNPGNLIYNPRWNYMDYINFVGGFGWRADDGDVRIIKARTGEIVAAKKTGSYFLEAGDTIWVPEVPEIKFWTIALQALQVLGQIAGIVAIVIAISRINR